MTDLPPLALPTRAELRSLALAGRRWLRQSVPERLTPPAPDERLVARLEGPFESVADVEARLVAVEAHLRQEADRRSVFPTVYAAMTARVAAGLASDRFEDPAWVEDYLVAFADRYRRALLDYERGNDAAVPPPWRLGFAASTADETVLVQDALLGVNAHINYDLPYTLRDVGVDPDRPAKRRDHDRINAVLRGLVDVVQRSLIEVYDAAGYGELDARLGPFDEAFTIVGLREARSLAWRNAVLLVDWPPIRRAVDWRVRAVSTGAGHFILAPTADPSVLRALRAAERADALADPFVAAFERRVPEVSFEGG